jgi:hypothetical protein
MMLRLVVFGWLFGMALVAPAFAELAGCSGLNQAGPKVIVGMLQYKSEKGKTQILTKEHADEFLLELRSRLQSLFPDKQPQPVLCENRSPLGDGSDFIPDVVESLNNSDVLLEVWGTIRSGKQNGKKTVRADIYMILIPVRLDEEEGSDQLSFHLLSYRKAERGDPVTAGMKLVLGTEFDVYTSIAHGIKELRNKKYHTAKKFFSNAGIKWEKARSLAETPANKKLVLDYIKQMKQKTIAEEAAAANTDAGYPGYREDTIPPTSVGKYLPGLFRDSILGGLKEQL